MTNAIFANARASALQASLLGADRLNRMVDCASGDDALKILSEVNFGNGVTVASALEADLLIEAEERRYTAFVRETAPRRCAAIFWRNTITTTPKRSCGASI